MGTRIFSILISTPPRAVALPPTVEDSGNIYLEFQKGASVRFWEIEWEGTLAYIEYGRVDRDPRSETKSFATNLETRRFAEKQIKAKLHLLEGADHGFKVPKKYGRTLKEVEEDVAATVLHFISEV